MSWEMMIRPEPSAYPEFEVLGTELEVSGPPTGADRNSPDYIRWVQGSLNQIMGLRLAVDGIMGPATRSAIRSFQQKQGLAADGIAGPKTKAALMVALGIMTTPPSLYPPDGQPTQRIVYGWSQYRRRVEELPSDQQAILRDIGEAIVASYQPGGRPVQTVDVYGHADWDTPRNPQQEQQMSDERARVVTQWLIDHVGNAIANRIIWFQRGMGAKQLKASPTSEENRQKNRRVEILLSAAKAPVTCRLDVAHPIDVVASARRLPNLNTSRDLSISAISWSPRSPVRPVRSARISSEWSNDSEFESAIPNDATVMQDTYRASRRTLTAARNALANLLVGFMGEQQGRPLNEFQKRVLISVGRWLKAGTQNTPTARTQAADVVRRAIRLMDANLAVKTTSGQTPPFKRVRGAFHAQTYGRSDLGIDCGDPFFTVDGPNCRRDVVTHEFFHFVGVKHGGSPLDGPTIRSLITTPDLALDSADNLAQLVSELMNGRTDACVRRAD